MGSPFKSRRPPAGMSPHVRVDGMAETTTPLIKVPVIAIDPGMTTGIALLNADGKPRIVFQIDSKDQAQALGRLIVKEHREDPRTELVIEDFVGLGKRSAPGIWTLKLIGWIVEFCKWQGIRGAVHEPQRRKWKLGEAKALIKRYQLINTPHTTDALAHALSYWSLRDG